MFGLRQPTTGYGLLYIYPVHYRMDLLSPFSAFAHLPFKLAIVPVNIQAEVDRKDNFIVWTRTKTFIANGRGNTLQLSQH